MDLPNIIDLFATAIVTDKDILEAIEEWKNKPPDEKTKNLITPEIKNDD